MTRLFVTRLILLISLFGAHTVLADKTALQQGKEIALDRNKGNCLSCHMMDEGEQPGNSGPPLVMMKARFPDRATLRSQIWDSQRKNPISVMPPYGRHHILSEDELDLLVDYIHSL